MSFIKSKSPDEALKQLVDNLSEVLGSNLLSVWIYGSKASGEFREDASDVNVFLLLEDVSAEVLAMMSKAVRAWRQSGQILPILVQKNELQVYADSLPIEFLDMQDHHTVLLGTDPLQRLKVSRLNLHAQCLQELAIKQLKLRQAVLHAAGHAKPLREILLDSLPSILTLYRAVLRLETEVPKGSKLDAAKQLARRVDFDAVCLERLWEMHLRRETDNLEDLTRQYLEGLERVLAYASLPQSVK